MTPSKPACSASTVKATTSDGGKRSSIAAYPTRARLPAIRSPSYILHFWRVFHPSATVEAWKTLQKSTPPNSRRPDARRPGHPLIGWPGPSGRNGRSVTVTVAGVVFLVLGLADHQRLGREQQARDRCGVGDGRARHLDRVEDALLQQVAVLTGHRVVALPSRTGLHAGDDDVAVLARVLRDPAQRLDEGAAHDVDTGRLVAGPAEVVLERRPGVHQGGTATGDDALLDGCTGRRHGVLDAVLALLELDLGGRTDLDDAD